MPINCRAIAPCTVLINIVAHRLFLTVILLIIHVTGRTCMSLYVTTPNSKHRCVVSGLVSGQHCDSRGSAIKKF